MPTSQEMEQRTEEFFTDIASRDRKSMALALEKGMSPHARNSDNISALTYAASLGFWEGAKLLLDAGANVNRRDIKQNREVKTPLLFAIRNKVLGMIELLLDHGADPRITDHKGSNAAHALIETGLLSGASLEALKTDSPHLYDSAIEKREQALALFERFLQHDGVANAIDKHGRNPLWLATGENVHPQVVDSLVSRGTDMNAMSFFGNRIVHRPWGEANAWKLEKYVSHSLDINAGDATGATVLSLAQDGKAVTFLVNLGADVDVLDNLGRNALAILLDTRDLDDSTLDAVGALIGAGVDIKHQDMTGASVESRLKELGTPEAKQLLVMAAAQRARQVMTKAAKSLPRHADPRP